MLLKITEVAFKIKVRKTTMRFVPFINMDVDTLERMKDAENFLPYLYTFFNFADSQNIISAAKSPLSTSGGRYTTSKNQEETINSNAVILEAFRDYYGDGEYERYLCSSFLHYLGEYNAPATLSVPLPSVVTYRERDALLVRSIAALISNYDSFKKRKSERTPSDINSLISIKSYFPSKYFVPAKGKLDEEMKLLFSKEMKMRGKRTFQPSGNAAIIENRKLKAADITTPDILTALFKKGLVEEDGKGFLVLTKKSELLSMINYFGVICSRDIQKRDLGLALEELKEAQVVLPSEKFFTPDEISFLEYVLGTRYENSLSLLYFYTMNQNVDEEKAHTDYLLLLSIMTAVMIKVMEEISLIPQTVIKRLGSPDSI